MELGVTLIFYGVYYGVMGRDFAELCVDYMAAGMTVRNKEAIVCNLSCLSLSLSLFSQYTSSGRSLPKVELTKDMCAVCGQRIIVPTADQPDPVERTYRLSCNHLYPLYNMDFKYFSVQTSLYTLAVEESRCVFFL